MRKWDDAAEFLRAVDIVRRWDNEKMGRWEFLFLSAATSHRPKVPKSHSQKKGQWDDANKFLRAVSSGR